MNASLNCYHDPYRSGRPYLMSVIQPTLQKLKRSVQKWFSSTTAERCATSTLFKRALNYFANRFVL